MLNKQVIDDSYKGLKHFSNAISGIKLLLDKHYDSLSEEEKKQFDSLRENNNFDEVELNIKKANEQLNKLRNDI
jgi:hypothetical protein